MNHGTFLSTSHVAALFEIIKIGYSLPDIKTYPFHNFFFDTNLSILKIVQLCIRNLELLQKKSKELI